MLSKIVLKNLYIQRTTGADEEEESVSKDIALDVQSVLLCE